MAASIFVLIDFETNINVLFDFKHRGHLELHRTCPLSGVKRILQLNAMTFALHSKELIGLTLR
jgi:FAD synthase